MKQVRVSYDDAPVHCIDVCTESGERLIRVRPRNGGATFAIGSAIIFLSGEVLAEFTDALSKLPR